MNLLKTENQLVMSVKINFAFSTDKKHYHISEVNSGAVLLCPFCKKDVLAKKGKLQAHHFAHKDATNSCSDFFLFKDYASKEHLDLCLSEYLDYISNKRAYKLRKFEGKKQDFAVKYEKLREIEAKILQKANVLDLQSLIQQTEIQVFTLLESASVGKLHNQIRNRECFEVIKKAYDDKDLFVNFEKYESELKGFSSSKITNFIAFRCAFNYFSKNEFPLNLQFNLFFEKPLKWWEKRDFSSYKYIIMPYELGFLILLKRLELELDLIGKDLQNIENQIITYKDLIEKENEWNLYFLRFKLNDDFTLFKVGITQRINERFAEIRNETKLNFELFAHYEHKGFLENWFKAKYVKSVYDFRNDEQFEKFGLSFLNEKTEYFILHQSQIQSFQNNLNLLQP